MDCIKRKLNHLKTHPNAPTPATKPWESTPPWGIIKSKPQSSTEANLSINRIDKNKFLPQYCIQTNNG